MDIQINELEPINGIRVFTASGDEFDTCNMDPIIPERHMVFVISYEDDEIPKKGEICAQEIRFFDKGMKWYSLVYATDDTVDKITESPMAQLLCCQTFFDHLSDRENDITEVMEINGTEKRDTYIISIDEVPGNLSYPVKAKIGMIGNILHALNTLAQEVYLHNYMELLRQNYQHSYDNFKKSKPLVEQLQQIHKNFAVSFDKDFIV